MHKQTIQSLVIAACLTGASLAQAANHVAL